MKDGKYRIEVELSGGSGKAGIESPAELTVTDGVMNARIVWSSSSYSLMTIGDKEYTPVSREENSVFVIEVPALDEDITVFAETVAMSKPHTIEYTLSFDSSALKEVNTFPLAAALAVSVGIAAVVSGVFILKRRKKR